MASVFDSSDSDLDLDFDNAPGFKKLTAGLCFKPVYSVVSGFVHKFKQQTLDDLESKTLKQNKIKVSLGSSKTSSEEIRLGKLFRHVLLLLDDLVCTQSGSVDTLVAENLVIECQAIASSLYSALVSAKKWPHQSWCELYIFCNLIASCGFLALDQKENAICHADYAFILGAPKEVTNILFRLVDPNVKLVNASVGNRSESMWGKIEANLAFDSMSEDELSKMVSELAPIASLQAVPHYVKPSLQLQAELCGQTEIPRLFENLVDDWLALETWRSVGYLQSKYGHRLVPIEIGHATKAMKENIVLFGDFIQKYIYKACENYGSSLRKRKVSQSQVAYLAQHNLLDQCPALQSECSVPQLCNHRGNNLARVSVWYGTDGTETLLHYDSYDNFLVQVAGMKYVVLFPASMTQYLYPKHISEDDVLFNQGNSSQVNVQCPDLRKHPKYSHAAGYYVFMKPGDTLFIPKGMWHYVYALTPSFSVNFWMNNANEGEKE